ncbi:hypothetical protein CDAR_500271 [Caerostris darwini]|uniref:Uncharacterized protein n=1 Tax=Caerostris darwini TaxID=1538125 RepID=A0AAV4M8R6_9ARAC|nr:hypothetical protein CDAR_500271 [Caerostris darwini]
MKRIQTVPFSTKRTGTDIKVQLSCMRRTPKTVPDETSVFLTAIIAIQAQRTCNFFQKCNRSFSEISSRRSLFCVASIVLRSIMPLGRAAVIRNWATDEQQPQLLTGVPLLQPRYSFPVGLEISGPLG